MGKLFLSVLLLLSYGMVPTSATQFQVARINDGDTITTSSGEKIRLLQIDTPELSPAECYGEQAQKLLSTLIGKSSITLESDPVSDNKDQFGRSLRYVKVGKININLKLVQMGAATPYFYKGEKGKYSVELLKAAQNAKAKKIGLWKACPLTKLDPSKPAITGPTMTTLTSNNSTRAKCDPNYQGCIPAYPPDLDCADIKRLGLAPVRIIGKDVHKFDTDGDRIGCNT